MLFLPAMIFIIESQSIFSQKYKVTAGDVKLNEGYVKLSNDVVDLTSKLTIAQNNLADQGFGCSKNCHQKLVNGHQRLLHGDVYDAR